MREDPFACTGRNADDFMFGQHHGKDRGDTAISFVGARTTYHQLDAEVQRTAQALYAYGIRCGDYISFAMPNLKETIVYIYACWRIGAIVNLFDPRTHGAGILERAKLADSKLLITVYNICEPKIDDILDELPCEHVILVSPSDALKGSYRLKPLLGAVVFDKKMKEFGESHGVGKNGKYIWHRDFIREYTYDEDVRPSWYAGMPAAIVYTSGTSADGLIKGAVLTHESLNCAAIGLYNAARPQDRRRQDTFGGFIPFFSSYGIMNGMHGTLCGGFTIIMVPVFDPAKFAEMLLKTKPNSFLGVPRFFEQLADHPKLQKKNNRLSFVKNPISGGDKISLASIERINAAFARSGCKTGLRVGYGSTELGASISVMPWYDPTTPVCDNPSTEGNGGAFNYRAQGNVGYILPQCRALVIDPETSEPLPFGIDGELCMHSRCMMVEYFKLPKETEEITWYAPDGTKYYRMGDKGHLDENGVFYFIDRYKRSLMRPDGHTVHPSPIENVIMRHPAVKKCAVVGLPLGETTAGSMPSAFVVLREDCAAAPEEERALLQEIDELCLKCLPERDRAIAYKTVGDLPYTPMGKVDFRALEKEIFDPTNFLLRDFTFFPELRDK